MSKTMFDALPPDRQKQILDGANGVGPDGKRLSPEAQEGWIKLRDGLKNTPFPATVEGLTTEQLNAITAAYGKHHEPLEISNELVLAISRLAAGQHGAAGTISALLSSLIPDPKMRKLVNGLINLAMMHENLFNHLDVTGADAYAILLPVFEMLGAGAFVKEVASAFAKANMVNGILSGDVTSLLDALMMFGNLSPLEKQAIMTTKEVLSAAGLTTPFKITPLEVGPPGVYVNGYHIAVNGSPTSCQQFLAPGPGSNNVLVYSQPAWRRNFDQHVCISVPPSIHGKATFEESPPDVFINEVAAAHDQSLYQEQGMTGWVNIMKKISLVNPETGEPWNADMGAGSGIKALDDLKDLVGQAGDAIVEGAKDVLNPIAKQLSKWLDDLGISKVADPEAPELIGNCGPQKPIIDSLILLTMKMGGITIDCTPHELGYGFGKPGYKNQQEVDDELDAWIKKQYADNPLAGMLARLIMRPFYNIVGTMMAYPRGDQTPKD